MRVRGSYALAFMFKDYPGEIYAARKDSPMVIGVSDGETFLASDVPAVLKYTRDIYYIDNLQSVRLLPGEAHFFDLNGDEVSASSTHITWDAAAAEKGGYEHFMIKEIHEQPAAVRDTLASVIKNGKIDLSAAGLTKDILEDVSEVWVAACGSAWHAGVAGQYVIEDLAEIPVRAELASEFRYRKILPDKNALVVIISQSGETADSLAALRAAKERGIRTLAVVNVVGSTIAREADNVLYTLAGPEIAVATTKAYSTQLAAMYVLAIALANAKGKLSEADYKYYVDEMLALPDKIERVLENKERIQWFASKYSNARDIFFIGRGLDYAISLEGSLKMKEISYIHSEAYAAGELKHGTISLIEKGILVIGVLTQEELLEKTVSNMEECRARGAYLMGVTSNGNYNVEDYVNFAIYVPKTDEHFAGSLADQQRVDRREFHGKHFFIRHVWISVEASLSQLSVSFSRTIILRYYIPVSQLYLPAFQKNSWSR